MDDAYQRDGADAKLVQSLWPRCHTLSLHIMARCPFQFRHYRSAFNRDARSYRDGPKKPAYSVLGHDVDSRGLFFVLCFPRHQLGRPEGFPRDSDHNSHSESTTSLRWYKVFVSKLYLGLLLHGILLSSQISVLSINRTSNVSSAARSENRIHSFTSNDVSMQELKKETTDDSRIEILIEKQHVDSYNR